MRGQGLVEYALILVVIAVVAIVIITLIGGIHIDNSNPCYGNDDIRFVCLDYRVTECVASERYTREECITLIGTGKGR